MVRKDADKRSSGTSSISGQQSFASQGIAQAAQRELVQTDPWTALGAFTSARIGLGRVGSSLSSAQVQSLALAHAKARDAVHLPLNIEQLDNALKKQGLNTVHVHSQVADRHEYLLRPDKGRRLDEPSIERLTDLNWQASPLLLVIGDGLSSTAVAQHGAPLVATIRAGLPKGWAMPGVVIASQARVAIADEIGQLLKAQMVAILIGERPGLSAADSLGVYFTFNPKVGCNDSQRNCLSNIRPQGMGYAEAAQKLLWLAGEALRIKASGVALKDESEHRPRLLE
ncbi:ethanolamine ammonia-lyase subunit EutC [Aliiglaciecola sp. CAU 1673]|uniref:ethanolamine ammonia-lyase subunit EutC n=1 Tax=Aliiglaciecola sp. CAU 1673 TaxID=3032595 RepID=UPI0023DA4D8F|nr:ethanolamine ammonia-lyase subunit EutC [Aliiglaciecola sp. CAU 1673]MDF2178617.1 ethanolamine ammonia-lyase subunit EutC [Aliiglaciecola sp. CAU 1673]